ncbi:MAG: porin [Rhizobiales bacterium 62-47]|nr:porin [Hyphomicrobiales bacterium]OJY10388.1 MAG: porin [Rhizobiales bacterium 62-47]
MNMIKSLILGSAAGIVALSGAQAADLPLKAKAVEYVKVCSLYGAGFYYIPGTDTCIKLGGYLRVDTTFNGSGAYDSPAWAGAAGQGNRLKNDYIGRARQDINIDTRTATEYGVVRTYFDATFNWTTGTDAIAAGNLGVYYAFIQFAGFTMGKAVSQFSSPWTGYPGNNTSFLLGGEDDVTGIQQLAYTAQFGNGVSASISLEDASAYRQSALYNTVSITTAGYAGGVLGTNSYAGVSVPDIVGQLRVDQAWGLFQLSAAAHQVRASYYGTAVGGGAGSEITGHPGDVWGYAVQGAISFKNLPTGAGDSINFTAGYANGASRYVLGGVSPNSFSMYGSTSLPGAYQSIGFGSSADGVFNGTNGANGTSIEKSSLWGVRGAFNHNWDPYWSSSLYGSYTSVSWGSNGKTLICGTAVGFVCNPDFNIAQIGTVLRWTPVKNLTFSGEVLYTYLDQKNTGALALPANVTKPAGTYELKDQGTWTVGLRAQRTF